MSFVIFLCHEMSYTGLTRMTRVHVHPEAVCVIKLIEKRSLLSSDATNYTEGSAEKTLLLYWVT